MSQWTHIRGNIEFVASAYNLKKPGNYKTSYLPYPDEQFEVLPPMLGRKYTKKKEEVPCLQFTCYVKSLPKCKPVVEEAVKILPQGECGFKYILFQDRTMGRSSSSHFDFAFEEKLFQKKVEQMYKNHRWGDWSFQALANCQHAKLDWLVDVNSFWFSVRDDIRYCSGEELMAKLIKFLDTMEKAGIEVEDGYLEWQDEYLPDLYFVYRKSRVEPETDKDCEFLVINRIDNTVLASKTRYAKWNGKSGQDWDIIYSWEESEKWKEYINYNLEAEE